MAKGITYSCANIWRSVARAGGWWSVLRLAREWDGVFSMDEIAEHLVTLERSGFLTSMEHCREGTVYAYTPQCLALPGENLLAVTTSSHEAAMGKLEAASSRPELMTSVYTPPQPSFRPGSMDHMRHPSLHMGQRRAYQGGAQ